MQLIRSERPELSLPSSRLENWFRQPTMGGRLLPSLFDFDTLWDDFTTASRLAADLYEDDEAYYARLELPGVKKEELHVELENAVLTVRFERKSPEAEEETAETYSRSLSVPDSVEAEKVTATLKDGILTVTMPKQEASRPHPIKVD